MTSPLAELVVIAPPPAVSNRVDLGDVEAPLATTLPPDCKRLVERYGPGSFDDFVLILQPTGGNDYLDLTAQRAVRLDSLRAVRDGGETVPYDIESGELLPWAFADNGDVCYWVIAAECRPDE